MLTENLRVSFPAAKGHPLNFRGNKASGGKSQEKCNVRRIAATGTVGGKLVKKRDAYCFMGGLQKKRG